MARAMTLSEPYGVRSRITGNRSETHAVAHGHQHIPRSHNPIRLRSQQGRQKVHEKSGARAHACRVDTHVDTVAITTADLAQHPYFLVPNSTFTVLPEPSVPTVTTTVRFPSSAESIPPEADAVSPLTLAVILKPPFLRPSS